MLVFVEGAKIGKLNSHMTPGRNRAPATLVGDEPSRHRAILAPLF